MDNKKPVSASNWNEWSRYVLAEIQRLDAFCESLLKADADDKADLNAELQSIKIEIAMLNVKSGVWGLVGGLIPVLIVIAIEYMLRK